MNKILIFIVFVFSSSAFSQQDAWVYFNAKPNSQFYFDNPLEMLSQRALDRRAAQSIAIDFLDVPIEPAFVEQIQNAAGITVMARSKWLNAVHVRGQESAINALLGFDFVAEVDFANDALDASADRLNAQRHTAVANPVNKLLDVQANFDYGGSGNQIEMLNGHLLHQQDFTGSGKIIAVLDAGFPNVDVAQPFQRLWDNNLILGGYNYVDGNDAIFSRNSHGTLVLSTLGGYTEGQLVGTAPDAQYYLFITEAIEYENPVEESYWVEAAESADSLGVDVITTSLGYFNYDNPDYSYTYSDMNGSKSFVTRGADIAFTRGMVVVASAGNSAATADPHIGVPADGFHVLAVGAVTPSENYAGFSSIGPSADGRVKPDLAAQGQNAVVANPQGNIVTANGTSFACPILAGMIATFWSAVPELTNQQVVDFVRQSADIYNNPNVQKGYGIPDFSLALQDALGVPGFGSAKIAIWPNPVASDLHFGPDAADGRLEIYDARGRRVQADVLDSSRSSVDCSKLHSGLYLYRLTTGSATHTGKFIKN